MSLQTKNMIYCDGACSGNPGPGGWGTLVIHQNMIFELGGFEPGTTNNRMEMSGLLNALSFIQESPFNKEVEWIVYTDSTYVIRGLTQWIWGWRKKGWKTSDSKEVSNKELWIQLDSVAKNFKLTFKYVPGHKGVHGNERCDEIAVAFSKRESINLYQGNLDHYFFDPFENPPEFALPEMKGSPLSKAGEKKKVLSYLSAIGGIVAKHSTWAECQRRVQGQSGAKFKKAHSVEEEDEILKSWGLSLNNKKA